MMPGGPVYPIPNVAKAAIARQLPEVPIGLLESAYTHYQLLGRHRAEAPRETRAALQKIAEQAAALYVSLGTLGEESRHALWDELEKVGGVAFFEQASFVSQALMGLARNAALDVEIEQGRPASWKHGFVNSLSNILEAHGYKADAKPMGALCFLTQELLSALDECPADVRALVRDALAKRVSG